MGVDFAICSVRRRLPKVQKGRVEGGNGFLVLGGTSTAGSGVLIWKGGGEKVTACCALFASSFFPAPEQKRRNDTEYSVCLLGRGKR